jgi:uncharacterized damage-inducible protein DinB
LLDKDFFELSAKSVRKWREMEMSRLNEAKCNDLSYRPGTGMSSLGWVLAHQAAVYDYTLNVLIKQGSAKNTRLFGLYTPGTRGDWDGTPIEEMQGYYDSCEKDLLTWISNASEEELTHIIKKGTAPAFFVGMTIREVLVNTFAHLNYHTGHLTALRRDWERTRK